MKMENVNSLLMLDDKTVILKPILTRGILFTKDKARISEMSEIRAVF